MKMNNLDVIKTGLDYYFARAVKANLINNADKLTNNGFTSASVLFEQICLSMKSDLKADFRMKLKGEKMNELVDDFCEILKTIEQ